MEAIITMERDKLLSVRFSAEELERIKRAKRKLEAKEDRDISLNSFVVEVVLDKVSRIEKS